MIATIKHVRAVMIAAWNAGLVMRGGDADPEGAAEAVDRVLRDGPHPHHPFDLVLAAIARAMGVTVGMRSVPA